uniref:Uncharacterized protein n=1 Tax=Glossina austeni TaxID=7395 RepID=A0A1A9UEE3_GLOAU
MSSNLFVNERQGRLVQNSMQRIKNALKFLKYIHFIDIIMLAIKFLIKLCKLKTINVSINKFSDFIKFCVSFKFLDLFMPYALYILDIHLCSFLKYKQQCIYNLKTDFKCVLQLKNNTKCIKNTNQCHRELIHLSDHYYLWSLRRKEILPHIDNMSAVCRLRERALHVTHTCAVFNYKMKLTAVHDYEPLLGTSAMRT